MPPATNTETTCVGSVSHCAMNIVGIEAIRIGEPVHRLLTEFGPQPRARIANFGDDIIHAERGEIAMRPAVGPNRDSRVGDRGS